MLVVGNATPNQEPHPVATAVLNMGAGVDKHVQSPGDVEPPTPGPIVAVRLVTSAHHHSLTNCAM